jgi:2-aminoethylphosphonate-pyruvate transaminase
MHASEPTQNPAPPASRDKLLFTPGPLTTSLSVKTAMLHDAGSWHFEFNALVASIRGRLLAIAGVSRDDGWESVLLQGSGTYGVEAVFQTCVPRVGKVAVLANGAYGNRMAQILAKDKAITHVAMVHCETTTGILNPVEAAGRVAHSHQKLFIVDAMSSFGGVPIDIKKCGIDFLISSPNKCLEGVPGFCFVLCQHAVLMGCAGQARSLSLDLVAQLKAFDANGQFRYTPPTHAILAFDQALKEFDAEGGVAARAARYRANHQVLCAGLAELGLRPYLDPVVQSYIITAFPFPADPRFSFDSFYRSLSERGFIIYPGKLTQLNTFRIGTIGRLFPSDIQQLVHAMRAALTNSSY